MASSMVPGKITLHSTSKIPLSERFKMVQQTAVIKKNIEPVHRAQRVSVRPLARGSLKNRQLAAALANKPSIKAALAIKKKSIKQRINAKPTRGKVATMINRTFPAARKAVKKSLIERLQVAPSTSGNARRPKLNRSNFVGATKVAPKNSRRNNLNRRQTGNPAPINRNNNNNNNRRPMRPRPSRVQLNNKVNNNQQMKNRRLNTNNNNNNFKGNQQQRQPQKQRQFNRRNYQQVKPTQQGGRARGGYKQQDQGGRNQGGNRRFQNRRPNNNQRQNQMRRRNPDKNSLDKDLDAYMAKTRTKLDADLDAYMTST